MSPRLMKVLDARSRGATTEAYGAIRRKPAPVKAGGGAIEGNAADDALMVDQGVGGTLDTPMLFSYDWFPEKWLPTIPKNRRIGESLS